MATPTKEAGNLVRKLRKKLRQIENLERLNRPLLDEEDVKIASKDSVRERLQDALADLRELEENSAQDDSVRTEEFQSSGDDYSSNDPNIFSTSHTDEEREERESEVEGRKIDNEYEADATPFSGSTTIKPQLKESSQSESKPEATGGAGDVQSKSLKKKKSKSTEGLARRPCKVTVLEGHNDLITDLVLVGDTLVTASRDTTLRCWNMNTMAEVRILGGHAETVTCVVVLEASQTGRIDPALGDGDQIIVSGSFDCYFKLWSLHTGVLLKSIYTYNPVTALAYLASSHLLVTGSDGGKLELWDLLSGENRWSSIAHSECVSGIKTAGDLVYSACADGVLKVHRQGPDGQMSCLFESERLVCSETGRPVQARHVRSLDMDTSGSLIYGDDSRNLKIVDWKKGLVKKVSNHNHNYSSADALRCHDNYLMTSSYDLDQGLGYINAYALPSLSYVATIDDRDTERIMCLDHAAQKTGSHVIITGGMDLKVWEIGKAGEKLRATDESSSIIQTEFWSVLSRPVKDSDSEGEEDLSEDEEEEEEEEDDSREREGEEKSEGGGLMSWCSIL